MNISHAIPEPGRPWVSARRAAHLLRRDPRTVRKMVRDREIDGGQQVAGGWFVYTDQPPFVTPSAPNLADENARLRARAEAAEEANRGLLTAQAALLGALDDYQRGAESLRQALDVEQERSHLYHQAAESYRRSADSFATAVNAFRDLSATTAIPDDLSGMTFPPTVR